VSGPANKAKLLIKWNNKNIESNIPDNAICIFWPIVENKNFIILNN